MSLAKVMALLSKVRVTVSYWSYSEDLRTADFFLLSPLLGPFLCRCGRVLVARRAQVLDDSNDTINYAQIDLHHLFRPTSV